MTDNAPEFTSAATVAALGKLCAEGDMDAAWKLIDLLPPGEVPGIVQASLRFVAAATHAVRQAAANAVTADPGSPETAIRLAHLAGAMHALGRSFVGVGEPLTEVWERSLDIARRLREFPPEPPPAA